MSNYAKKYKCHGKHCDIHHKPYIKYSNDHIYNINHEGKIHYIGKSYKKHCCNYGPYYKKSIKPICKHYCKNGYYYPRYINEYYPNHYYHNKYCSYAHYNKCKNLPYNHYYHDKYCSSYDYDKYCSYDYHKCKNLPYNHYYHKYLSYPKYDRYRNSIFNHYGKKYYDHSYYF